MGGELHQWGYLQPRSLLPPSSDQQDHPRLYALLLRRERPHHSPNPEGRLLNVLPIPNAAHWRSCRSMEHLTRSGPKHDCIARWAVYHERQVCGHRGGHTLRRLRVVLGDGRHQTPDAGRHVPTGRHPARSGCHDQVPDLPNQRCGRVLLQVGGAWVCLFKSMKMVSGVNVRPRPYA